MNFKLNRFKIWFRWFFWTLMVVVVVCGAVGGYLFMQITARVSVADTPALKVDDMAEVNRKLALFEESLRTGRKGFIHFSQGEINAYVEQYLGQRLAKADTNQPAPCQLIKARAFLTGEGLVWVSWVRATWKKWSREVVWQRAFDLVWATNRWDFRLRSMYIGQMRIPERYWTQAGRWLGETDGLFAEKTEWVTKLPAVQIWTNDFLKLELKLYNYPDTNVLKEARQ